MATRITSFFKSFYRKEPSLDEKIDQKVKKLAQEAINKAEEDKRNAYLTTGGVLQGASIVVVMASLPFSFIVGLPLGAIGTFYTFKGLNNTVQSTDNTQQNPTPKE